ncbi:MAG: Quinoprotein glucose dehydrogenase [Bryobacterales bacterium]|nr:Quinoprotein glucose dehydrogenase [Bryobacterales bacterium]
MISGIRTTLTPLLALVATGFAADLRSFNSWNQYLGGADSSQYSSLNQINKSNVKQLAIAWSYATGETGQYLFNPLVVDGVMYVQAKNNALIALDAVTGRELWVHPFQGPVTSRGMNYWESKDRADRRLFTTNAGFLTAIDARTGQTVMSFGDNGRTDLRTGLDRDLTDVPPIQTNNPGRIFEDIIIMPLMRSGADYSYVPGDIHAYNVRTGKLLWQFHTVPRPGEFGYETWPKDFWTRSGGGINWNELTIDEKRGIAYIPTGTGKWDHYGADRIGQNLFANSIIALDARTGKRLWHFQTVHHDLWDYDLPAGPKLLTVKHDGKNVDVVIQPTKHGFLFVLDRVTGQPLWPIEERPVPKSDVPGEQAWPTQPFPTKPPPFARQALTERDVSPYMPETEQVTWREKIRNARNEGLFTPPSMRGTVTIPGVGGGASWGTAAVDPAKGALYIVSKDAPTIVTITMPGNSAADQKGKAVPHAPPITPLDGAFTHYTAPYTQFVSQSSRLPSLSPPWFQLTAYDLNAGTIKWQIPYGTVPSLAADGHNDTGVVQQQRGGPVVTAGGLIFSATNDKKLRAYDTDTGKVIWETDLPASAEGVPAVYEVGGREYIGLCVAAGNGPGAYMAFALPRR